MLTNIRRTHTRTHTLTQLIVFVFITGTVICNACFRVYYLKSIRIWVLGFWPESNRGPADNYFSLECRAQTNWAQVTMSRWRSFRTPLPTHTHAHAHAQCHTHTHAHAHTHARTHTHTHTHTIMRSRRDPHGRECVCVHTIAIVFASSCAGENFWESEIEKENKKKWETEIEIGLLITNLLEVHTHTHESLSLIYVVFISS